MLKDLILSILSASPSDQYSLFKKIKDVRTAEILKTLADLQHEGKIHVVSYRKNQRTGFDVPVYSLDYAKSDKLDVHTLLHGVASERHVEYDFVARNLVSRVRKAMLLDIGSAGSALAKAIQNFAGSRWLVFGIDLRRDDADAVMDARFAGFRDSSFDMVTCISTIEHIGLSAGIADAYGDIKTIKEIHRILKPSGRAIITVPYAKSASISQRGYRIYDRQGLQLLAGPLSIESFEFYLYSSGKWSRCTQRQAENSRETVPMQFHSIACACLLLEKLQKYR